MDKIIEEVFFVIKQIRRLDSICRIFDLFYDYNNKGIIPNNFSSKEQVYEAMTELHVMTLSFIYSIFDKSGIDIRKLKYNNCLTSQSINLLDEITELWTNLEPYLTKIRHKYGFHGLKSSKELKFFSKICEEMEQNNVVPKILFICPYLVELSDSLQNDIQLISSDNRE